MNDGGDTVQADGKDFFPKKGYKLFKEAVTDVVVLEKTYRFVDKETKKECEILPRLFAYMRKPEGQSMPDDLWHALVLHEI